MRRSVTLPADPSALLRARDAVLDLRDVLPETRWRDARIAVSELVANALRHGASADGDTIELVLETNGDVVRAEIYDDGAGFVAGTPTRGTEDGGWGLYIVDLVSVRWGVEQQPRSCVWFEIARAA